SSPSAPPTGGSSASRWRNRRSWTRRLPAARDEAGSRDAPRPGRRISTTPFRILTPLYGTIYGINEHGDDDAFGGKIAVKPDWQVGWGIQRESAGSHEFDVPG